MGKIGLVTVLFKSDDVLEGFFKSISSQDYKNYWLYLIDNSVTERTNDLIKGFLEKYSVTSCKHIKNSENIGVAAGNNTGIKLSIEEGCSHVLLLNNDIEIPQSFLLSKILSISETKGESIIVPKIFYYPGKKIWMAGGYIDKFRALGVHYGYKKNDLPRYNISKHVTYSPTCFMLIRKEVFEKVGLIDEKYFAYYDDTDFIFRAGKSGYKVYYEPSLYILHKVSAIAGPESPFYVYYSNRNKIYFIKKNFKGFLKYFSLGYTFVSRVVFWMRYDKERKRKLIKGIKDGFKIPIIR